MPETEGLSVSESRVAPVERTLVASVVVPVRNGGAALTELLNALAAQTLPRDAFEVVLADDGSVDGAAAALATGDGWLRVEPGPPRNSYAARNRGARAAGAPVLVFCDADCKPHETWLENGLREIESADIVAGDIRFAFDSRPSVWGMLDMEIYLDQERRVNAGEAVTANLLVRRTTFEEAGGFDDTLPSGGDRDFVSRCVARGARLVYAKDVVVEHPLRDGPAPLIRKIWTVAAAGGARRRGEGRQPDALKLRAWVPIVSPLRVRLRMKRALGLDLKRLAAYGIRPSVLERALALPLIYVVLPYTGRFAQVYGWMRARRQR